MLITAESQVSLNDVRARILRLPPPVRKAIGSGGNLSLRLGSTGEPHLTTIAGGGSFVAGVTDLFRQAALSREDQSRRLGRTATVSWRVDAEKKEALLEVRPTSDWQELRGQSVDAGDAPGEAETEGAGFAGYPPDVVAFVRQLAVHTTDMKWHKDHRQDYLQNLRDPTEQLFQRIAARHLTTLDPMVAAAPRRLAILKKNDYGGNNYYPYFWGAFYDPEAGSKTKSAQLSLFISGADDHFRYGFGVGDYGRPYFDRLCSALRADPCHGKATVAGLPSECVVTLLQGKTSRRLTPAEFAAELDDPGFIDSLSQQDEISVHRARPLDDLVSVGPVLADEIGGLFVQLWPLFEAARHGEFLSKGGPLGPVSEEEDPGEEALETLEELAQRTSLPSSLLREMEDALLAKGQLVLIGPPGTSKTYIAREFAKYFVRGEPNVRPQGPSPEVIYMHANWTYEDFFVGVRPKVNVNQLSFERRAGALLRWIGDNPQVQHGGPRAIVILDELNRCDTAAVFGELLQLLEHRGETVRLMNGEHFVLPRGLYIIGTMNSADRSVGRMDLALRRRFYFFTLRPESATLAAWLEHEGRNPIGFDASALVDCNRALKDAGIPEEQHVGHALFMASPGAGDSGLPLSAERLRQVVNHSVIPYVRELVLERGRDPEETITAVRAAFSRWIP